MPLDITPLEDAIAAEVSGIDLSQAIDTATQAALDEAWNRYAVLVYRGQDLPPEAFIRFSRGFGELEIHVLDQYLHPAHPEVFIVSNIVENGRNVGIPNAGVYWHTDLSYKAEPSRGSILYAIEIPEENGAPLGDTMWTSTAAAYDALPEATKRRLDGLEAAYSLGHRFDKLVADGENFAMTDEQKQQVPEVVHPVVRTHPLTGRKCIFVNEGHTVRILGLPEAESRALLEELFAHTTAPQFVYRHKWRPGDVVMWDNVQTQHIALRDYALPQRRLLHRTTLTGERPF